MSLYIASLNSGSNGNCYYVGNEKEAILVDAGISCRETEKRMTRLGLSMQKVKAIFVSHEHSDHIRGVEVISRKYGLPVYITPLTLKHSALVLNDNLVQQFRAYEAIHIGELSILAFPKQHDAADPFSFIIGGKEVKVGVFTDIGCACENVILNFKQCHAIFLEANYDEEMLETGAYPYYLKKRIQSDKGHLSNKQALDLFMEHKPDFMNHVLLSHLSKDNNSPQLVYELFLKRAGKTKVVVASRDEETAVYKIEKAPDSEVANTKKVISGSIQMSLFP